MLNIHRLFSLILVDLDTRKFYFRACHSQILIIELLDSTFFYSFSLGKTSFIYIMKWAEEEIILMKTSIKKGLKIKMIAKLLKRRTYDQVKSKYYYLKKTCR